jgi:hypothetical protein
MSGPVMNDLQLASAACPVHVAGNVLSVVSQWDELVLPPPAYRLLHFSTPARRRVGDS